MDRRENFNLLALVLHIQIRTLSTTCAIGLKIACQTTILKMQRQKKCYLRYRNFKSEFSNSGLSRPEHRQKYSIVQSDKAYSIPQYKMIHVSRKVRCIIHGTLISVPTETSLAVEAQVQCWHSGNWMIILMPVMMITMITMLGLRGP